MTMLSWDEIGERHPEIYGDPEVHGDKASHGDGEGIGWAAAHLAYDRPESHEEEQDGHSWDMYFHEEQVHPKHIDYARRELDDPRVAHAREGYRADPSRVPPVVLVHRHGVYQVADGHHRAQAAHQVGVPVRAYVAYSPHEDAPFHRDEDEDENRERAPFHGAEAHPGVLSHRQQQMSMHWPGKSSSLGGIYRQAEQDDDYRQAHTSPGPDYGAPLHDLRPMLGDDFYEHPEYHRHGTTGEDESISHALRVRGRPDAKVRIYRAIPAEHVHKGFRTGDWVSTSRDYALKHARESHSDNDWPVIRTTVRADQLFNAGDITEYGYHGPHKETAMVAFKGGKNQEVRQHADGVVRKVVRRQKESTVQRIAVLQGFARRRGETVRAHRQRTAAQFAGPKLVVYAHVSGNSIDVSHCPFCGSGAVFARSDGTIEDSFCTAVFTVQVQPQFAAFPQTAEGMPYQWPGRPGADQLAGGGDGAMGGFPGPIAGEQDQGGEEGGEEDGNPFDDGAGGDGGSDDSDDGGGSEADVPGKAQVGGKDKPPFGKKSYRTAAGHRLGEREYIQHLAIRHAHRRGDVARLVRDSRR